MQIAHHIFPTKHNNYIPHLLREKQVIAMLVIGIAAFSFSQYARVTGHFGLAADVYPATVITLTNKDREANALPPLTRNATLEAAAKLKAQDMATKGYFAHTSPEGRTPWYWFAQAGYNFLYAGENLAVNFDDTDNVEQAWLNSPTHRANIMNKNFTEMGVATATGKYNGQETTFVVELFGMPSTPRAAAVAPKQPTVPPKTTAAPKPVPKVAGESSSHIAVLKETPTYAIAQNTDPAIEPGNPVPAPAEKAPWYAPLILHSDRVAGLILEIMFVLAIITVAGMVAREYEKRHRRHMAYGALLAVIMFSSLFVGRLGIFASSQPVASAPSFDTALQ